MGKIQAIILAGGKGTRLAPLTDNLPKPLVVVGGVPMIAHVLRHLKNAGITRVAIATAHLGAMIEDALGDGHAFAMDISYLREPEPMGTGGWTQLVDWDELDDNFLVLNADNLFWIDVGALLKRHRDGAGVATIAAIELPSESVAAAELLLANDERTQLTAYVDRALSAPHIAANHTVLISSGWYVMTTAVAHHVPAILPVSNEVHIWPALAASGETIGFYHATEPWFDSGTHERLARVEEFLKNNPEYGA